MCIRLYVVATPAGQPSDRRCGGGKGEHSILPEVGAAPHLHAFVRISVGHASFVLRYQSCVGDVEFMKKP